MKLFFYFTIVFILCACTSNTSESEARRFISKHKENYLRIFDLMEKNGYVRIQWKEDSLDLSETIKAAYLPGTPYPVEVKDPKLE